MDVWTYIWFDELGEEEGDKVELVIEKLDPTAPTAVRDLNIIACYAPVGKAKDFVSVPYLLCFFVCR